jgi:hypothetical membrane protein
MSATLRLPHEAATAGTRRLLVFTGLGPIAFLAIASLAGAVAPAYDPLSQTISDLVFTPLGWLQTLNFYLFGAATIGFGIALAQILGGNAARTSGVLLAVSGISLIAAGVFPAIVENGEPTPSMLVHGLAFFFTFLPLPGAYAFAAIRLRDDRTLRGFASYTAAVARLLPVRALRRARQRAGRSTRSDLGAAPAHPGAGRLQLDDVHQRAPQPPMSPAAHQQIRPTATTDVVNLGARATGRRTPPPTSTARSS